MSASARSDRARPRIEVLALDLGHHPEVLPLNPRFREGAATLKLTLDVHWRPERPRAALAALEGRLAEVAPSLRRHQCRGPEDYRVFRPPADGRDEPAIEAALALAHLVEHVILDTVSFVTGAPTVSGVTGAHRGRRNRFDVFVECATPAVARLASGLALHWTRALLAREALDGMGRPVLALARYLFLHHPVEVDPRLAAADLDVDPAATERLLDWLRETGFAREVPWSLNFSGIPRYALADGAAEATPPDTPARA